MMTNDVRWSSWYCYRFTNQQTKLCIALFCKTLGCFQCHKKYLIILVHGNYGVVKVRLRLPTMSSSPEGESYTDTLYAHTPPWPPHLYLFTCLHKASSFYLLWHWALAIELNGDVQNRLLWMQFLGHFMEEGEFIWLGAYISSPRDEMQDTNCPEYHEITASRHQGQL